MRKAIALAAFVAVSCSGSSSTVVGTLEGTKFSPQDAISFQVTNTVGGVTFQGTDVVFASVSGACDFVTSNTAPANASEFVISIISQNDLVSGTYDVGTLVPPFVTASFTENDSSCQTGTEEDATSGDVVVTTIAAGGVVGSFDLTFKSGDHVTGTFNTANCAQAAEIFADGGSYSGDAGCK